jgi:hypothetical protein
MKLQLKITLVFIFLYTITFAQDKKNIWPITNENSGQNILNQPQDYIGEELNYNNLFIGGKEGIFVISPCAGVISSYRYTYPCSLNYVNILNCNFQTSMSLAEFDSQFRTKAAKQLNNVESQEVDPKYISLSVCITTEKKGKYWISGLRPHKILKTGYKINQGDTIGTMGYAYQKIASPCINFSRSIHSKPADPMSIFDLSSSFITHKVDKIDYLTHKFSKEKITHDFRIFKDALEEAHPGLYDYTSKSKMDKLFAKVLSQINKPLTSEEFKRLLLPVLQAIKDSHTFLHPKKYRVTDGSVPPVSFGLLDSTVLIYQATTKYKQFIGKKIVSFNNEPINKIIPLIESGIYGTGGYIQTQRKRKLIQNFVSLYSKYFSMKSRDQLHLKFADKTSQTFTYAKINQNTFLPKWNNFAPENKRIEIKQLNPGTYILDINTFELLEKNLEDINQLIVESNTKPIKNLIIDLRDNLGGSPEALEHIFSLLADKPFRRQILSKVNKKGTYGMFANCYNHTKESKNMYPEYEKIEGKKGFYLLSSYFPEYQPNDSIHFGGKIKVLINEYSCSASTVFAALIRKYKRGIIIGRETGSTYYQLNATNFARVNLNNSGLELRIPLVKSIFDEKGNSDIPWGRGVIPDYNINISLEEFLENKDKALDFALSLIKKEDVVIKEKKQKKYILLFGLPLFLIAVLLGIKKKTRKKKISLN